MARQPTQIIPPSIAPFVEVTSATTLEMQQNPHFSSLLSNQVSVGTEFQPNPLSKLDDDDFVLIDALNK